MPKIMYGTATNCTNLINASVNVTHGTSIAVAMIEAEGFTGGLNDPITINIGYSDNHANVFTGYVKDFSYKVPDGVYQITANDIMIRAVDDFIASDNPDTPVIHEHAISGESLVEKVLNHATLNLNFHDDTSFTFAVSEGVYADVQLVSAWDYCRQIGDILTWSLWADGNGATHFENRKGYVMTGSRSEPGWANDTSSGTLTLDNNLINISYKKDERNLRNRVVVYGSSGISATASATANGITLPANFYKTVVVAAPYLLDDQTNAQTTADYNLANLNKVTENLSISLEGNPNMACRTCWTVDPSVRTAYFPNIDISGLWYIYALEHSWSKNGYITNVEMRK